MKKRMVGLISVIFLLGLILPGCVPKAEMDECRDLVVEQEGKITERDNTIKDRDGTITELEAQKKIRDDRIAEVEKQLAEKETQISELEVQLAEFPPQMQKLEDEKAQLQGEIVGLEAQMDEFREPAPKVKGEIVGTITFDGIKELLREFFPNGMKSVSAFTRGPYPLTSLETIETFILEDPTHVVPTTFISSFNVYDERAFRFKDHWIRAELPPMSLGLIKKERTTVRGEKVCWYNIFITREGGEYVIYEVDVTFAKIVKIEPTEDVCVVIVQDRM